MTRRGVAIGVISLTYALHVAAAGLLVVTLHVPFEGWGMRGGTVVLGFVLPTVAAVLTARVPRNRLGWLLAYAGVPLGINSVFVYLDMLLLDRSESWTGLLPGLGNATWVPGILLIMLAFASFPDGRLPAGWPGRVVAALFVVAAVSVSASVAVTDGSIGLDGLDEPSGADVGPLFLPFPLYVVATVATVVSRFRRSEGLARQQFRWVAYAFVLYVGTTATQLFLTGRAFDVGAALSVLTMGLLLVAFAVAILRYRLYDLDRIVSRTATYAALTAVLLALYAVAVLLFGRVARAITDDASSPIVIALSTLVAAAAFDPARRRLQSSIDRRLNRARYDARAEVEQLGGRLVDEVDRRAVEAHVVDVIARTVQPAAVALWAPGNTAVTARAYTGER